MTRTIGTVRTVAMVLGVLQLALGLLFWGGIAKSLEPAHIAIGSLFVLALWTLAFLAARSGVKPGPVILSVVWGLIIPVLGLAQKGLLPGGAHWLIQALHLAVGLAGIGLVNALAARSRVPEPVA